MLKPESWQRHTLHLPPGQRARVEHDCGPGRVLLVSNKDEGYSAWCFRCNDSGFIPHPQPSLSERLAALERARNAEERASSSVALPEPATYDPQSWPAQARLWLYKAGLSNDDIERLRFYYHQATGRVVLPVYRDGQLVYWQARSVDGRQPKYINPEVDKSTLYAPLGTGPCIVLTEDILSAARVARVTEAWSLMGTALPTGVLAALLQQGRPVVVMLDPDAAGVKANTTISKRLAALGVQHSIAVPHRDPKYLTKQETVSCIESSAPWACALGLSAAALPTPGAWAFRATGHPPTGAAAHES